MSDIPVKFRDVYDKPREEIVDWLREPDIQKALRENNMYKFYDILSDKVYNQGYGGYNIGEITNFLFSCGVNIFDYIDMIPDFCFSGLSISHIDIPDGVSAISSYAFEDVEKLSKIVIPGRIKYIPLGCFENSHIDEIILEEGVEEIGPYAFSDTHYVDIYVPDSVSKIDNTAFDFTEYVHMICSEGSYAEQFAKENRGELL